MSILLEQGTYPAIAIKRRWSGGVLLIRFCFQGDIPLVSLQYGLS